MTLKKGQTNNPNGAPNAWETFSFKLKKYNILTTEQLYAIDLSKIPVKDVIVINQIKKAIQEENQTVISWISERDDGKVKDQIELTGENGDPINLTMSLEELRRKRNRILKKDDV